MSRLVLLIVGYSNFLYGNSTVVCTEKQKGNEGPLENIYLFPDPIKDDRIETTTEVEYLFDGSVITDEKQIIAKSQLHIECSPDFYEGSPYVFDRPLPDGWLYPQFYEDARWKKYFDTGQKEYWVFPNVHCDKKTRRLTAMSWMRSGKDDSHKGQGPMHNKFKGRIPPLPNVDGENGSKGVYCGWNGWLYPADGDKYEKWFDTEDNEAFTIINVYCRNNRVIYLHKTMAGNIDIAGQLRKPFKPTDTAPLEKNDNWVRCDWKGWLYKAWLLDDTWKDGEDLDKRRWTYERYFIVNEDGVGEKKKQTTRNGNSQGAIHGRVMNPYCSPATNSASIGVVTAIRAYCFYPSSGKWNREKKSMCDDLK